MKQYQHFIRSIDDVLESLNHGEKLTKFIAKSEHSDADGLPSVEIHGFLTDDGEFIIVSERFEYKNKGLSSRKPTIL